MSDIIIPTKDVEMKMSLQAFHKIAKFVLTNPIKPGDRFTIEGTDKKKLIIHLE